MKRYRYIPPVAIVVAILAVAVIRNSGGSQFSTDSALMMDTLVQVSVWGKAKVPCEAGVDSAMSVLAAFDTLLGDGRVGPSDTAILDAPEVKRMLSVAADVYRVSGGLFDPTIGAVSRLWVFGEGGVVPDADSIRSGLTHVGLAQWMAGRDRRGALLDLGGIAKGCAVEAAAAKLAALGFKSAIVSAGGDMRLLGKRPDGKPWRIAIRDPRREDSFAGYLELEDVAVSTSGDYERFFTSDGKRYHHILDPRTGSPSPASVSVTVVAPEGTESDALSTAFFLMGHHDGAVLAESMPGVGAVFIYGDGDSVEVTGSLRARFERARLE